jgi:protein subunit release factor A
VKHLIELEENKHKLISIKERLKSIGEALRITEQKKEIKELEAKTNDQGFWDNNQESSNILTKMKRLLNKIENFEKLQNELENLESLNELLLQEEDIELGKEVLKNTSKLEESLEKLEMETLLSGKYDKNNAIFIQELEEQNLKTGQRCYIECTVNGQLTMALRFKN